MADIKHTVISHSDDNQYRCYVESNTRSIIMEWILILSVLIVIGVVLVGLGNS